MEGVWVWLKYCLLIGCVWWINSWCRVYGSHAPLIATAVERRYHVLQPIVGNYFRNSAQDHTVLDFLGARSERQREAAEHIRVALGQYLLGLMLHKDSKSGT